MNICARLHILTWTIFVCEIFIVFRVFSLTTITTVVKCLNKAGNICLRRLTEVTPEEFRTDGQYWIQSKLCQTLVE